MLPPQVESLLNRQRDSSEFVIRAHHIFMKKYGYIPLSEFREMPATTFWNLWELIVEEIEAENRALQKRRLR